SLQAQRIQSDGNQKREIGQVDERRPALAEKAHWLFAYRNGFERQRPKVVFVIFEGPETLVGGKLSAAGSIESARQNTRASALAARNSARPAWRGAGIVHHILNSFELVWDFLSRIGRQGQIRVRVGLGDEVPVIEAHHAIGDFSLPVTLEHIPLDLMGHLTTGSDKGELLGRAKVQDEVGTVVKRAETWKPGLAGPHEIKARAHLLCDAGFARRVLCVS